MTVGFWACGQAQCLPFKRSRELLHALPGQAENRSRIDLRHIVSEKCTDGLAPQLRGFSEFCTAACLTLFSDALGGGDLLWEGEVHRHLEFLRRGVHPECGESPSFVCDFGC